MVLRWVLGDASANSSTIRPGNDKKLILEVTNPAATPGLLNVMQIYGPVTRTLRRLTFQDTERLRDQFDAVRVDDTTTYRSDRSWWVPTPRGGRVAWRFVFDDVVNSQRSLDVRSHRLGSVALNPEIHVGLSPIPGTVIGASGKAAAHADVTFSIDPEVAVAILSGPELAQHLLADLTADRDDETGQQWPPPSPLLYQVLGDIFTPPTGWTVAPREPRMTADGGETRRITLDIDAQQPGSGFFAVAVYDLADPELVVVSEPWRIATDQDLRVWTSPDMTAEEMARLENSL